MEEGKVYDFLKKGQRLFYLSDSKFYDGGQIPLCKTAGNAELSDPVASIKILEATHFLDNEEIWTKGKYEVIEIFNDEKIHFNWMKKI